MRDIGRLIVDPLSAAENRTLKRLEGVVDKHIRTFFEVGNALMEIREKRLYWGTHHFFEEYCHDRWGIGASRARQLIGAAQAVENLKSVTNVTVLPKNEGQVRPLVSLDPGEQRQAWKEAVRDAPEGRVTAAQVEKAASKYKESARDPKRDPWTIHDATRNLATRLYEISEKWPKEYLSTMVDQLRSLAGELEEWGELRH